MLEELGENMEIAVTVLYIVACVAVFSLAIAIHEFGHFIVALKLGLKVEAFSIGMGWPIWRRKFGGVEYRIGIFPIGGYVSIPDVDPEGTSKLQGTDKKKPLPVPPVNANGAIPSRLAPPTPPERVPAWKEIAVAFAGPFMNIVLAVALAVLLASAPEARFGVLSATVQSVLEGSPAERGGILAGDMVLAVGGNKVNSWTDMQTEVQIAGTSPVDFRVVGTNGEERVVSVTPERDAVTGACFIGAVRDRGNGAAAWMPERSAWGQLKWDAMSIFRVLKGLVSPKEAKATAGALGGPVMIAEGLYRQFRHNAWDGIGFLRFINVNLAILNLLPIPVLDGGLILFSFIALVFRRRLPDCFVKWITNLFMVALIALMALLIFKDSLRSWRIHTFNPVSIRKSSGGVSVERSADK